MGMEASPSVQGQLSWAGEVESVADSDDSPIGSPRCSERSQHEMVNVESSMSPRAELLMEEIIPEVAKSIAEMEVTNPEILRVTRAFAAFQNFAAALRGGCDGDLYYKSRKSHKISTFWSHSWHGGQWKKILTLLTFYNGFCCSVEWLFRSYFDDDSFWFLIFSLSWNEDLFGTMDFQCGVSLLVSSRPPWSCSFGDRSTTSS